LAFGLPRPTVSAKLLAKGDHVSRLVVRLLLSIAAFPTAAMTGILGQFALLVAFRHGSGLSDTWDAVLAATPWSLMSVSFVGCWLVIWRQSVRWTGFRRIATASVVVGCVVAPIGGLLIVMRSGPYFPIWGFALLGGYLSSIPLQVALIWRSTRREETERLLEWRLAPTPRCPYCQGMLAGRMGARCPHCGGDLVGAAVSGATS
jgi:hypothetical protein